ncbi:hypothetical protein ACH5RR_020819 [Cinchona calisaya]|uniref:F-box domain-containing protein n=1 Tax=Cinchona calisaya TaxID=153742 RepID=A0ABD2ZIV7_9GENT
MRRKRFKIFDGIKVCWSGHMALPLIVLAGMAGTGVAIGIGVAITSSSLWEKMVTLVEQRRKHEGAFVEKQADRISLLSDDLLSDIISRLNVVEAVRTRILSRRWRNIFQSRSKLHFCCDMFRSVQHYNKCSNNRPHKLRFIKAVDQCLQQFSGQSISFFGLECCLGKEFDSNFNRWMQSFATLGVQELVVKFHSPTELHLFPFQLLFELASLESLDLDTCTLQPSFKGQFKSLRFLYLGVVPLLNGEFASILSSCVNLDKIEVDHCELPTKLCSLVKVSN